MIDGRRVKELREQQGMTLRSLAEKVWSQGIPLSAERIRQIEDGGQDLKFSKASALAAALGVTLDEIDERVSA